MVDQRFPRKLAAILYADVAGYSRLTGEDEDRTHHILGDYLDRFDTHIRTHNGRVVHHAGDAVLAEFGTVTDALLSAMQAQRDFQALNKDYVQEQRVEFRVGVNLGEVLIQGTEVHGDGVNIAARLESIAVPGGVCVSDSVRIAAGKRLPLLFEARGPQQLKNISERVRAFDVTLAPGKTLPPPLGINEVPSAVVRKLATKPSILVLPFQNIGGDSVSSKYCEAMTEDVITELSRFRSLSVVSRTTSYHHRGEGVHRIGEQLGVHYVLEGSLRWTGKHVRVTAQLIDCGSEQHVWAERYETDRVKFVDSQDEVIAQMVGMVEKRMVHERLALAERAPADQLGPYDFWLKANHLMDEWTLGTDIDAIPLLERAIELDPGFARAHSSLGGIYQTLGLLEPGRSTTQVDRARALKYLKQAVQLDPTDAGAHVNIAWGYMLGRDFDNAQRHFTLALKLNPNDPNTNMACGQGAAFLGDAGKGIALADRAMRLNPMHPDYFVGNRAMIEFLASNYAETAILASRVPGVYPEISAWHAAALGHLGRGGEAVELVKHFLDEVERSWAGGQPPTKTECLDWFLDVNALRDEGDLARVLYGLELGGLHATKVGE